MRGHAEGANFEYKDQALRAMEKLTGQLEQAIVTRGSTIPHTAKKVVGLGSPSMASPK